MSSFFYLTMRLLAHKQQHVGLACTSCEKCSPDPNSSWVVSELGRICNEMRSFSHTSAGKTKWVMSHPTRFPICILHLLGIILSSDLNSNVTILMIQERGRAPKFMKVPLCLCQDWDPSGPWPASCIVTFLSYIYDLSEALCHRAGLQRHAAEGDMAPIQVLSPQPSH
jgi:hypothetical protein